MKSPHYKYDVSVIIPTYNRAKLLGYTLDSLVSQNTNKDRFEVVVGDDGSSDETAQVVEAYRDSLNIKYTFQEDKGYRPASARNKAIRLAEGAICLFVDSSVILHPDCIDEHIRFHKSHVSPVSAIGYVYGFDHNEESEDLLMRLVDVKNPLASVKNLSKHKIFHDIREVHYDKYNDVLENLRAPWYYFWTCHLSIAARDLAVVGLFDEGYDGRWGVEDNDLGFRLHRHGVKICLLRRAKSIHYPHGKNKPARQREGFANCQYFNRKFNTLETRTFLDIYLDAAKSLVDLHEICARAATYEVIS